MLLREYIDNELSLNQIADKMGCSKKYILLMMKEHRIPRRLPDYSRHLRSKNTFVIVDELRNYIDGLLVSDGHLLKKNQWSARYDQNFAERYLEWAETIKRDLKYFRIESKLLYYTTKESTIKSTGQIIHPAALIMLYTSYYDSFLTFRSRWYKNGSKVVPTDIKLTPQFCANWYMGDGDYDSSTGRASFSTHSFSLDEIKTLAYKLKRETGIICKIYPIRKQNNQLLMKMSRKESSVFFDYIRDHVVSCFEYKLGV